MALYLKYRPKDFESLIWQDFINKTLRQAIKTGTTVWAYLLCWPRWTWKTSTARILAKWVNCINLKDWNPCNKCEICESINNESLVDVIEIDAASNTWIDNIREIISKATFRPTNAKFKIYIIDEVHMLSKWAFNALLKILEEPPEFVKFILATTETHKVPETIISRCQRYDFKCISNSDLKNRLEFIASQEKIEIEDKAIDYIINSSWWWARNAISLFEQLIIEWKVTYKNIEENLWVSSSDFIEIFLNKLLESDKSIIDDFEKIINEGKNIKLFFKDLIFFTRDEATKKIKNAENIDEYIDILEELDSAYSKVKNSIDENTTFLIAILKIINISEVKTPPIISSKKQDEKKEEKIEKIENKKTQEKNEDTKENENISNKQEIEVDDLLDIFPDKNIKTGNNSNTFNKEIFIKNLKDLWAKWSLIMWIKWAECYNDWEVLEIKSKTEFALKQINTIENIKLINEALQKMNIWNLKLNLI